MALIALDTNTISHYFRGDAQVVPRLQALRPADVAVPAIVEYELRYGATLVTRNVREFARVPGLVCIN